MNNLGCIFYSLVYVDVWARLHKSVSVPLTYVSFFHHDINDVSRAP